jgi:4-diphosphocytidyl-2-C-methyl-D-erythritol kinase
MGEAGALASLMSGSGPAVFALAEDGAAARKIAEAVKAHTPAGVWISKTRGAWKINGQISFNAS